MATLQIRVDDDLKQRDSLKRKKDNLNEHFLLSCDDYYFSNYSHPAATILSICTRKIIAGIELTDHDYELLKTIADMNNIRNPFYVELLDKMHKHGIYFKNEAKPGEEDG